MSGEKEIIEKLKAEILDHKKQTEPEELKSFEKEQLMIKLREELDKEHSRNISIKEGGYSSVAQGVGHNYVSAFAIALGASNAEIGILASVPRILAPIAQLFGSRSMEHESRKKILIKHVALEALIWIPILLLGIIGYYGIFSSYLPIILIILYGLLFFIGNLAVPAWFSWMGDIVPQKIRGKFFAKRNRILGAVALITMLLAAFFLDIFKTRGLALIGFSILFFIASVARGIAAYLFTKKYEPEIKLEKGYYFSLLSFIKKLPQTNFGKFVIFLSLFSLAQFIAAPFFAVYMLNDLGLPYIWFTAITISGIVVRLFTLPIWGKLSDKYGNRTLLRIGAFLIPLIPISWLFSTNPYYLVLVPGIIGGLGWGAFIIGTNNFIYDSVTPQKRGLIIAYYSVLTGAGVLLGGLIGSVITQYLTITFMNIFLFVFLISGIGRFLVGAIMLPKIKEPRKTKEPKQLAKAVLKELRPIHYHEHIHEPSWFKYIVPSRFDFRTKKTKKKK